MASYIVVCKSGKEFHIEADEIQHYRNFNGGLDNIVFTNTNKEIRHTVAQLPWENIDIIIYESEFCKDI